MRISFKIVIALALITGFYIISTHLERLKQIHVPFHGSLAGSLSGEQNPQSLTNLTNIVADSTADTNISPTPISATTGSRATDSQEQTTPTPLPLSETAHDIPEPTSVAEEKEHQQAQATVEETVEEVVEVVLTTYMTHPGAEATAVAAADNVVPGTALPPLEETASDFSVSVPTDTAQQEEVKGNSGDQPAAEQGNGQVGDAEQQQDDHGNKGNTEEAGEKQPQESNTGSEKPEGSTGNDQSTGETQQQPQPQQPPSQNPSTEQSQHTKGQGQAGTEDQSQGKPETTSASAGTQDPASPSTNKQPSGQAQDGHTDNSPSIPDPKPQIPNTGVVMEQPEAKPEETNPYYDPEFPEKMIVMGHLAREDVLWVDVDLPGWNHTLYTVDNIKAPVHTPVNKGHEVMAYLTFIIDHYDNLPEIMAFIHSHRDGGWHSESKWTTPEMLEHLQLDFVRKQGYANLRCATGPGCPAEIQMFREPKPGAMLTQENYMLDVWREFFNETEAPPVIAAACCAQFVVTRDTVRRRPKSDYKMYRYWLFETSIPDEWSGRIFEYLWHIIFGRPAVDCPDTRVCRCNLYGQCES